MLFRRLQKSFSILKPRENLLVSVENDHTLLIRLNRPKSLNALCDALIVELNETLDIAQNDKTIRSVVITGNERAFAAGADIKEMVNQEYGEVYLNQMLGEWDKVTTFRLVNIKLVYILETFK